MTSLERRPEQGKFGKEETDFLKTHLPAYGALCDSLAKQATGPRGTGLVKGCKKDWILSNVLPQFVKQFSSDQNGGPQVQSLQTKLLRWFANHAPNRSAGLALTAASPVKRPRATNGAAVFAKEHKAKIVERMAEQQDEGGAPKQVNNLPRYHSVKQELYDQLTDEERRTYEAKAAEKNETCKAAPETSLIFENQRDIVGGVVMALDNLVGWGWGQYGEAVFFVQGAYRNADNNLKTFNVSVTPHSKTTSFSSTFPDYKEVLRAPFREWAENALPVHSSRSDRAAYVAVNQKYAIGLEEDGHPRFPVVDVDLVAPNDARLMLKSYIELTWLKFTTTSASIQELDSGTVPWDLLNAVSLRRKLLINPEAFSHMKTLDPMRMSPHDVYAVLALLLKSQESGVRLLEFSTGDVFNSKTNGEEDNGEPLEPNPRGTTGLDMDRIELSNSLVQLPLSPVKCTADGEICADSPTDKAVYSNGLVGPQPPDPFLSPLSVAPRVASPAIDTPSHSSSPLSQSQIKAAIENVVQAGYLNVTATTIQSPNQGPQPAFPRRGKAKTSSSSSKKRKREEQSSADDSQKMEKQPKQAKQAVPIREQSSRLKDANYRNKHVTVRPR